MIEVINTKTNEKTHYVNMSTREALVLEYMKQYDIVGRDFKTLLHHSAVVGKNFIFLGEFAGREYLLRNSEDDTYI